MSAQEKPIICTFVELQFALQKIHGWEKRHVDTLHDVWKIGAPTPDSRLLQPKIYDPRLVQPGNVEKRIVFPKKLAAWVQEVTKTRGIEMSAADARYLVSAVQKAWAKNPPAAR